MGNCVGGFKRRTTRISPWKRNRAIVLAFLGIDGAGKTTIVKALQGEDFGTVHPTMGFSRAEVSVKKYKLTVYDLGGSNRIRDIWPTYFAEVYGVVFVVDSSAVSRLQENKQMMDTFYEVPELVGKPILFLLNKKDLPEALDEMQFSERFNLHSMAKRNKTDIRVEGVCAVKGTGKEIDQVIIEGLEWLIEKILDNYETISKGVEQALKKLKEKQAQDRLERQHRLAAMASVRGAEDSPEEARSSPETGEAPTAADEQQQEQGEEEGRNGIAAAVDQQQQEENAQINGELAGSRKGTAEGRKLESANGKIAGGTSSRPTTSGSANRRRPPTAAAGGGGGSKGEIDYRIFEIAGNGVEEMEMRERIGTNPKDQKVRELADIEVPTSAAAGPPKATTAAAAAAAVVVAVADDVDEHPPQLKIA